MKKIKIDSNYLLIGAFLLITGLVLGISIGMGGTFALEGEQLATAASATSKNATSTNATSTNATATNATATNATSTNASRTDNILYLNELSLAVESAKPGDKVNVGKMTSGACNSGMSLYFIHSEGITSFSVNVENMNGVPYFIVPKNTPAGLYHVGGATLIGLNSNGNTFSKVYGFSKYVGNTAADVGIVDFDIPLTIVNEKKAVELKLDKLLLTEKEALVGEKVNISYTANDKLTSLRLFFKSDNNTFNATVLDLDGKAYFSIPSTVKSGEYSLTKIVAMSEESSVIVTEGNLINNKIIVKDNEKRTYIYNNSDLTEDIIKKLYDDQEITEITINVDEKSVISEDVFKIIIGTDRKLVINTNGNQIIFNGNDVKTAKAIDTHMTTSLVNEDSELVESVKNGVIVNFVSNGNLPGNALVRLKATDKIRNTLGNGRINIYYFDEVEKVFNVIAENVVLNNGYYEFAISHNSKYILTTKKLDKSLIAEEEDNNVVGFRQSDNSYLLLICGGLVLILIVIVVILIAKNKKREN